MDELHLAAAFSFQKKLEANGCLLESESNETIMGIFNEIKQQFDFSSEDDLSELKFCCLSLGGGT